MIPNLDLFLLAILHASFIACVLLLIVSVVLIGLLLAFSVTIFSIAIIDLREGFLACSLHCATLKANLYLGLILLFYMLMHFAVSVVYNPNKRHGMS